MKLYGLIGYPLVQSFSQPYFRKKFTDEGIINTDYLTFPIPNIEAFADVLKNNPNLKGINVTSPYKQQILSYVDIVSNVVTQCGATNCIKISDGKITAYNTDVIGFEKSLLPLLQPHHHNALVLGTGGAAKAVAFVLAQLNINFLYVTRGKVTNATTIHYNQISKEMLQDYTLIINASPSGMMPNEDTFPDIPYQYITPTHLLYDLVYKPAETIFLQKGKQQGATLKNGFEMLILQAEAAWEIWNNDAL